MNFRTLRLFVVMLSLELPLRALQCEFDRFDFGSLRSKADRAVRSGNFVDAESLLRQCHQEWAAGILPTDPRMLSSTAYLGQVLGLQGRWTEAEPILQQAYSRALASGHPESIGTAAASLGGLYRYQRDTARALPLLRIAHRRFIESRGPTDFAVGMTLTEIGALHMEDGHYATAEHTFLEARGILQAAGLVEELLTCDMYIAAAQINQGRLTEAEARIKNAQRSVEQDESALAGAGRVMGEYHLARIYRLQGRNDSADAQYRKAIAAYEAAAVQPFPALPIVVEEYAAFLHKWKAPTAKAWAARARALQNSSLIPDALR